MKKLSIVLSIIACSGASFAQTERIAHRSHSGKDNEFKITGYNNWGETPGMKAERAKRDSLLKAKADTIATQNMPDSTANFSKRKHRKSKKAN